MQFEWNFLNHLVTVLWSTARSSFAQQISWTLRLLYCDQLNIYLLHNKFLEQFGYCTVINCTFGSKTTNVFWLVLWCYCLIQSFKALFPKLDYIAYSSEQLSNHTFRETMHNMSAYQLPWYDQPLDCNKCCKTFVSSS